MKAKEIAIWLSIIIILIGGLWLLISAVNNSPSPSTPLSIKIPEVSDQDISIGSPSARVTLVEYSDFQCPACKAFAPLVTLLSADFIQDLRVVYRFFPLIQIHQNAMLAAQAAYAAGLQGKFWEMHDLLFENQTDWANKSPKDIFIGYAKDLKLEMDKFTKDLDADSTKQAVNKSLNEGVSAGISFTPSFFLNGKFIQSPADYEVFKKVIQDEIDKK
ncbi:MAG: ppiB [Candidatus Levybacteria bacterium]|nr:ppiB [Candidatus Levybacteria bacterium]